MPDRKSIPELDAAFLDLEKQIGLQAVKDEMHELLATAKENYDKEKRGLKISTNPLNRHFIGNPGTGNTTIARF